MQPRLEMHSHILLRVPIPRGGTHAPSWPRLTRAFRAAQPCAQRLSGWPLFLYHGRRYRHSLRMEPFAMKTILKTILCVLVLAVSADAANYTVKSAGGGSYTTIQACATAMAAGDTCTVYAGTYNENVTVSGGSAGSYKTLTVNPGDTVYVYSFTIGSHVVVNGFHIQNPSSPTNAPCVLVSANSTDIYVTNNNMYACAEAYREAVSSSNTTYVYIQGNTISYMCSTSSSPNVCTAMAINGDHHLLEHNDISHVSDGPYIDGKYNVMRYNTLHDFTDTDCGSNSGNCHVDFMQADAGVTGGGQPSEYLLMEGNTITNMVVTGSFSGSGMHAGPLLQAEACNGECYNAIFRFNVAAHIYGGGTTNDNSGVTPPPQSWINVKEYNNDWIDMLHGFTTAGWGVNSHTYGSSGGADVNEIFYFASSAPYWNPYMCMDTACTGYTYGHDLAYCAGTPCTLYGHTYGSGSFTSDPGNLLADPKFNNYAGNDFTLVSGSPAIGAGTYLTTVASASSGTSLVVNDAGFFQDGYGLAGVSADCIAVKTTTQVACITAVSYATNTLTLASSITSSVGDPVWLYSDSAGRQVLLGTAPSIGAALATSLAPNPPTNLTVATVS
jgi:hypothetical protein